MQTPTKELIFRKSINTKVTYDEGHSIDRKRENNIDSIFRKTINTQVTNEDDDLNTLEHADDDDDDDDEEEEEEEEEEDDEKFVERVADQTTTNKRHGRHRLAEKMKEKSGARFFVTFIQESN